MKKLREKLRNRGGFTLIEMLIVVAIIAILIAIAIPLVNSALEKSREATDAANERAAIGLAMAEVMANNELGGKEINGSGENVAYYAIEDSRGFLTPTVPTAPATSGGVGKEHFSYGKGTDAGDEPDHTNQGIKITYDPTKTEEIDQFTVTWMD